MPPGVGGVYPQRIALLRTDSLRDLRKRQAILPGIAVLTRLRMHSLRINDPVFREFEPRIE